jgi:adenylate cyclase
VAHAVFISHSAKDRSVADAICGALEQAGFRCWIAPRDVQPGKSFAGEITRAIQQSEAIVLVFSRHSNESDQVLREVQLALESKVHVVQFRIAETPPNDDLKYFLGSGHWLDAVRPPVEKYIPSLVNAVRTLLRKNEGDAALTTPARLKTPLSYAPNRQERGIRPRNRVFAAAITIATAGLIVVGTWRWVSSRNFQAHPGEKSIAVLPLIDLSEGKNQEYLCDGVSEELLDTLAKVPGLRVAARTSSFSFKAKNVAASEIAGKLGVAHLVAGSLRREGNRIRVTAELINANTGFRLWSDTFERELRDVFVVEDEITHAIVDALKVKLAVGSPTRSEKGDAEVNDLYLQGLYFSNKSGEEGLRKALVYFQQALDKDPRFSRAWTGVAKVWVYLADAYVKPLEAYPLAQEAAQKAIALNERDAEAHCFLGMATQMINWDPEAFLKEARRAVEVDANSALGHIWFGDSFRARGNMTKAIEEYRTALRLDPLSPLVSDSLAEGYMIARNLDQAIAQAKRTLELDPSYAYLDSTLANALREKGMFDEAIAIYRKGEGLINAPSRGLAITYARAGRRAEAEQVLAKFLAEREKRYISASAIGIIYGALGNKDEAFRWLERGYNDHDAVLSTIAFYPGSQPLRDDPRFIDLVRRVGLDPSKAIPH